MKKLIPIHKFNKIGSWLAVVVKHKAMYVVAAAKEPKGALDAANRAGFKDAALMRSARHYAAFISVVTA